MNLVFDEIDTAISINNRFINVIQVEQPKLFSRLLCSLMSCKGREAEIPYTIWDDREEELNPTNAFLIVTNPVDLPWKDKGINNKLYGRMNDLMMEDDELRQKLSELQTTLNTSISFLGLQLRSDVRFNLEWNLQNYLKCFGFSVDLEDNVTLLDNLISFIDYIFDLKIYRVLLFVNLKIFLTENELKELYSHVIFLGLRVLLLEGTRDSHFYSQEKKHVVEQEFLEYSELNWSDVPSSAQRRICFNGFGAVTI